ncbi:hypothetical protein ACVRXQ_06005 [Streptococcus panodentis]|uniref:Colicin V production protein n=1 Tax=Streptococcus panodentis TaxID=1581472 RepID=A0ABS5AV40_9STRE|nr:hypothetical protein [Streptococcus panodentis]MBP2620331.1 hypothetical protein [Streptococcus panodentis]
MNTGGLQGFLQGDGFWLITFIAIVLVIMAWRKGSFVDLGVTIFFYAVIAILTGGGRQLLSFVGWIFRTFLGWETGL